MHPEHAFESFSDIRRPALAFGVLIVVLLMGGSLWIMANLNHNMMPMDQLMWMQR